MCAQPGPTSTPTLRSIDTTAPSSNPYRPPTGSSMPPPPLQPAPPRAPPRLGRPIAPACCCPRLSLSLSNTGLTRTVLSPTPGLPSCPPSPGRCPTPAPLPRPLAPTLSANATSPDVVDRRPALDAAAHLPWPLLHPTLSTGQLPTSLASLSRRPTPQPPNSGRWLWTSPA
jgi:hypothetical protein